MDSANSVFLFWKELNAVFENQLEYCVHHFESSVHFWADHLKKDIEGLELEMSLEQNSYEDELGLFSLEIVSGDTILLKML